MLFFNLKKVLLDFRRGHSLLGYAIYIVNMVNYTAVEILHSLLWYKRNIVVHQCPITGKTHNSIELAKILTLLLAREENSVLVYVCERERCVNREKEKKILVLGERA